MTEIKAKEELKAFLEENSEKYCVVKFSAPWCRPCRELAEVINTLPEDNDVKFVEVNVDKAEESLIEEYNVRNIPLLVFLKGQFMLGRTVGLLSKEDLINKINEIKNKE